MAGSQCREICDQLCKTEIMYRPKAPADTMRHSLQDSITNEFEDLKLMTLLHGVLMFNDTAITTTISVALLLLPGLALALSQCK